MKRYELSTEQFEFFHEHGYLSGVRILAEEQVEALRTAARVSMPGRD